MVVCFEDISSVMLRMTCKLLGMGLDSHIGSMGFKRGVSLCVIWLVSKLCTMSQLQNVQHGDARIAVFAGTSQKVSTQSAHEGSGAEFWWDVSIQL